MIFFQRLDYLGSWKSANKDRRETCLIKTTSKRKRRIPSSWSIEENEELKLQQEKFTLLIENFYIGQTAFKLAPDIIAWERKERMTKQ